MKDITEIKQTIDHIAGSEGAGFEYDLKAIENAYTTAEANKSNLVIKILSILGGLFTSSFLGFILIESMHEAGLMISGIIILSLALWINIKFHRIILDTISITGFVLGICLISMGIGEENYFCFAVILLSIPVMLIAKNYIISFISVLMINGCFIFLIMENDLYYFIHVYNAIILAVLTYVVFHEAKLISGKLTSRIYYPIRIGLIISFVSGLVLVGIRIFDFPSPSWISSVITIPMTIYIIYRILRRLNITDVRVLSVIYALSLLILIPTAYSPAISGSLIILFLCFSVNYKTGMAIGILSFIYFISQYYYDLNFTLLFKSIVLMVSGVLFLIFYFVIHKKYGHNE